MAPEAAYVVLGTRARVPIRPADVSACYRCLRGRFEAAIAQRPQDIVRRLGIAHAPEGRGAFVDLSVEENLRLGACARRDTSSLTRGYERVYQYLPPAPSAWRLGSTRDSRRLTWRRD